MSNITGDGGSFSSDTNAGESEVHKQSLLSYDSPAAAGNSDISTAQLLQLAPAKKKRNLPGTPDPEAEVIALSPKTLMATNRFVCEVCRKGFQRDQNLQLHRRGHNLPWKLRQRNGGSEARKKVYVCPEPTCVHHNPGRALGDLTGIKKHYCRKHGEKKWKCDNCSKKYAVQSDWKAHSKICGTRQYKCECGTIFSRRDSFMTHRAFCDALAQENKKLSQPLMATMASSLQGQAPPSLVMPIQHTSNTSSSTTVPEFSYDMNNPPAIDALAASLASRDMAGGMFPSFLSPVSFDGLLEAKMPRPMAVSAHASATSLLQNAAQIGATQRSMASVMAGRPYQVTSTHGGGSASLFYASSVRETGDGSLNEMIARCGSGDVMTVDFLGVGGQRRPHMQQQQQRERHNMEFGGVLLRTGMEITHPLQLQQQQQQMAYGSSNEPENLIWDI
ncbi:hypothetical protein OPV22_030089 [Ensete ventricosum]|uniref:Protein EARLY HEADING DATE 2 n=1 Tax=Ensete ventricosum TaxID=4639 RepID=A0AAV8P5S0_ENSVE|nr:hypothetical protein OPV22_030089 [Ensete ventricosum]